jgi:hypothetical protein
MSPNKRTWFLAAFAAAVVLLGGFGMVYKMTEFTMTIVKDDVAGFGVVALAVYFTGMLPLLFLTLWGICAGHFRDIERPKYRMLELDREIETGSRPGAPSLSARRGGQRS